MQLLSRQCHCLSKTFRWRISSCCWFRQRWRNWFRGHKPTTDNVSVWRNNGAFRITNTQFTALPTIAVGDNPSRIYTGDFDRDGKIDLLIIHATGTTTTQITILQNQSTPGTISFSAPINLTNTSALTVAHVADLDGDGKPEIITTSESGNRFSIFAISYFWSAQQLLCSTV